MSGHPTPLLILGLGNVLCGDDGFGVGAVTRLQRDYAAPAGVLILDGGTLGLSLLPYVQDAAAVILLDAVAADAAPGCIVRVEGKDVATAVAQRLSSHQVGVADLLFGGELLGGDPSRLTLLGVVPERFDLSVSLSAPVLSALPAFVEQVVAEAASLGFDLVLHGAEDRP